MVEDILNGAEDDGLIVRYLYGAATDGEEL
jgi:hypothetical protein